MLEIFALISICKSIGRIAEGKGRSAGWYKFLAVVLWFGGEVAGCVVAILLGVEGRAIYIGGIAGALASIAISFTIVKSVSSLNAPNQAYGFPVQPVPPVPPPGGPRY